MKGTCDRGQLPSFDQFWSECIQEEIRELSSTSKEKEEELVLAVRIGKRGKWKKGKEGIKSVQNPKIKKVKYKLKCFNSRKLGYFAAKCKKKRKGKHHASTIDVDEDTLQKRSRNDESEESYEDRRKVYFL